MEYWLYKTHLANKVQENRQNNRIKQAFSIAEMSVVVAIIAILLVTLLAAKGIIRNFRIENAKKLTHNSPVVDVYNEKGEQSVKLWFEATNIANFKFSSEASNLIKEWQDISANGNHALQTDSNLYPSYIPDAINNLPAIEFAVGDSSKYLDAKGALDMLDDTYSIAIVWSTQQSTATNPTPLVYIGPDPQADAKSAAILLSSDDLKYVAGNSSGTETLFSSIAANVPYVSVIVKDNAKISAWLNQNSYSETSAVDNDYTNLISEKLRIGDSTKVSDAEFDGYIGELIIFDKALNNEEAENILDYLGQKWQIVTN